MVGGVINVTAAAIDEAVCAAVVSEVIDIGFVVIRWREFLFAIVKVVAADHHAERCERIEIPFGKVYSKLKFFKSSLIVHAETLVVYVICFFNPSTKF